MEHFHLMILDGLALTDEPVTVARHFSFAHADKAYSMAVLSALSSRYDHTERPDHNPIYAWVTKL